MLVTKLQTEQHTQLLIIITCKFHTHTHMHAHTHIHQTDMFMSLILLYKLRPGSVKLYTDVHIYMHIYKIILHC